jgi:CDP-4-dehydro-6-deoxyglucose reductase
MIPQWQKGIVTRIEQVTANTRRYWVSLEESPVFTFKPGQFVTLDLPIHEQRNKRWRSYSIASMPDESNIIELLIVYVEGGLASKYIFSEIKVGSEFTLRGPSGVFVLPENLLDKEVYFICTGTGIAPFRSMLSYINYHQLPHKQIHLLFGTRTQKDLLYADEMKELERMLPAFSYRPVLSREAWEGDTGYVHAIYENLVADKQPAYFMLCGWRAMIDEAKDRLLKIGYDKKDVHIEIYG